MRFSLLPKTLQRVQHSPTLHSERGRVNPVPKYYKTNPLSEMREQMFDANAEKQTVA